MSFQNISRKNGREVVRQQLIALRKEQVQAQMVLAIGGLEHLVPMRSVIMLLVSLANSTLLGLLSIQRPSVSAPLYGLFLINPVNKIVFCSIY